MFANIPPELMVFGLASLPISELRGAIPLGIAVYGLPIVTVFLLAVLGNILPIFLIYALGGWWLRFTQRRKGILDRVTEAICRRARGKLNKDYEKYGLVALALFVAVPLPLTGAWTGTLAAFLFGIPFKKAFWSISAGVLVAAVVVTLATTGAVGAFKVFLG